MRIVKLGLISFVVLFLIVFGISLLIPGYIRISRAVNITAPKDSIQHYLTDLRQWKQWNGLTTAATVVNPAWSANTFTSDGLQVALKEVKTDTITTNWKQEGGREIASGFTLHTIDNTTVVQWYFDFKLRWYPWEKFGSIIFDKQLGPPMEQSLGALKKKLESIP
ncbi:SRPBCC family protein [Paraflavitalea sp. CAU 1676]|uniref:SRPBCC family protein n=1 Tax=Paraflavitalea sp. CAU 1676 TaxID=3032598 RepID=UPI0023DBE5A4|nr:SRPBCC family protein [Paraflavitalea sp. CAU 1676]MDF2189949.1 SRPBCC family protein [Paraflavitalea sp. CAU 1676]